MSFLVSDILRGFVKVFEENKAFKNFFHSKISVKLACKILNLKCEVNAAFIEFLLKMVYFKAKTI